MFGIDWANLEVYHYLAMAGGALAVLALALYFIAPGVKVSAGITGTVAGVVAGIGLGVIGMAAFGYQPPRFIGTSSAAEPEGGLTLSGKGVGSPGINPAQKGGGKGKGGKGSGPKGPSPKAQLASLVEKLDQLTAKPLAVNLTTQQRSAIAILLKGLADEKDLSDDDAKKRLDSILEIINPERATLEAAGYRWPTEAGGPAAAPANSANPFQDGDMRARLTSLQDHLGKKG